MNFRNTLKSVLLAVLATGAVSCVEKEFNEIWRPYLDLDRDYAALCKKFSGDKYLKKAV